MQCAQQPRRFSGTAALQRPSAPVVAVATVVSRGPFGEAEKRCTSTGAPAIGAPCRSVSRPETGTGAEAALGFAGAEGITLLNVPITATPVDTRL